MESAVKFRRYSPANIPLQWQNDGLVRCRVVTCVVPTAAGAWTLCSVVANNFRQNIILVKYSCNTSVFGYRDTCNYTVRVTKRAYITRRTVLLLRAILGISSSSPIHILLFSLLLGSKTYSHVSSPVTISRNRLSSLSLNLVSNSDAITTRWRFCSSVSKCGIHRAQTFRNFIFSFKIKKHRR